MRIYQSHIHKWVCLCTYIAAKDNQTNFLLSNRQRLHQNCNCLFVNLKTLMPLPRHTHTIRSLAASHVRGATHTHTTTSAATATAALPPYRNYTFKIMASHSFVFFARSRILSLLVQSIRSPSVSQMYVHMLARVHVYMCV